MDQPHEYEVTVSSGLHRHTHVDPSLGNTYDESEFGCTFWAPACCRPEATEAQGAYRDPAHKW